MDNGFDPLLLWGRGCFPVGVFEVDLDLDAVEAVLFGRQSSLSSSSSSASASDEGGNYDSSVVVDDGDNLVPSFDASERKLSVMASTFCLVASSFGAGGAIFLPLAFEKFGTINIVPSFLSMIIIAYLTDRSLYLLCLCARRSGVASHGEVARVAFGRTMEKAVFALVFVFLLFILTFNSVIIRDVWTSIVQTVYNVDEKLVLLVCLTIVIPFSIQRRLYALRKYCYFGFATIMAFSVLLWYLGYAFPNNIATNTKGSIFLLSSRVLQESGSYLSVIPIFVMSFHSTFNILQTQAELQSPTNDRIQSVISRGVTIVFFINFAVGFAGGVILRENRKTNGGNPGNLNLNIPQEQEQNASLISTIAWLCYGTAVLAALPVILVSARYNCLELINRICLEGREDGNCQRCRDICPEECCDDEEDHDQTCMTFPSVSSWSGTDRSGNAIEVLTEQSRMLPRINEETPPRCRIHDNTVVRYISTGVILALAYLMATLIPSVTNLAEMWILVGSIVTVFLSYTFPAVCYLQISKRDERHPHRKVWSIFSWLLAILSTCGSVACTVKAFTQIMTNQDN